MKKILLFPLAILSFILTMNAQNQQKIMYFDKDQVLFSAGNPAISSLPGTLASGGGTARENGYYDAATNGLVVYTRDDKVYNSSGNPVPGTLGQAILNPFNSPCTPPAYYQHQITGNEIAIVPLGGSCTRFAIIYYVFEANHDCGILPDFLISVLRYSIYDSQTGTLVATDLQIDPTSLFTTTNDYIYGGGRGGIAISKFQNNAFSLYAVRNGTNGTFLDKYTISASGISPSSIFFHTPLPGANQFSGTELDLSPDGSKLTYSNPTGVTVVYLNANGDWNGNLWQPVFGSNTRTGVEFSPNSTFLYAGVKSNGIYQLNVNTQIVNGLIPGTSLYGNSMLETSYHPSAGYNIMAAVSTGPDDGRRIGAITNPNTIYTSIVFNPSYINFPSVSILGSLGVKYLPDQIDGQDYSILPNVLSYSATTFNALTPGSWTQGSNPITGTLNPPVIRIQTALNIFANISMQNMTFEFAPGASLVVTNGKSLMMGGTVLRGVPCNGMWQGVLVQTNALINMTNSSSIRDAIVGITASNNAKVNVNTSSTFNANETHIKLTNVNGTNILVSKTSFLNTVALKDQSYGVFDPLLGAKTGNKNIEIINSNASTPVTIGDPSSPVNQNNFTRGQYGIYITNSNVNAKNNSFFQTQNNAIYGNGALSFRNVNITDKNIFSFVAQSGILLENGINSTIQGNTFNSGIQFGIFWKYNRDCKLLIGDPGVANPPANLALWNTFNNNNWAAIMCSDNASTQNPANTNPVNKSEIRIMGNTLNGAPYAGGIVVQQNTLGSQITYHHFEINVNNMTNIGQGIILKNIRGFGQGLPSSPNFFRSAVVNCGINFSTQYNVSNRGIKAENCPSMNFSTNDVRSNNYYDWRNTAINVINSPNSLIYANTCQAGKGVQVALDMLNSNIMCNNFIGQVVGVQLEWEWLRNPSSNNPRHGTATDGRKNGFSNTAPWGYGIEVYYSNPALNQWVFEPTGGVPTILYTGVSPTIVSNVIGVNNCPNMIAPGGDDNLQLVLNDPVAQWKSDYEYHVNKIQTGQGNSSVASTFIKKAIKIEDAIKEQNYNQANGLMSGLTPTMPLETYYKQVLATVLDAKAASVRPLTQSEINDLTVIAELNPRTSGPAVYTARAILKAELNMDFEDDEITGRTIFGNVILAPACSTATFANISIGLIDNDNNVPTGITPVVPDSTGKFVFDPYQLRLLDTTKTYAFTVQPNSFVLTPTGFKTISQWISSGSVSLNVDCPPSTCASGAWTQKANFGGTPRFGVTSFVIGNKGYMGTGYDDTNLFQDFWEYDPQTDVWTQKATFPGVARFVAVGMYFAVGDKGYFGTGWNGSGATDQSDVWEYNATLNSWTQKANFGGGQRNGAVGFTVGNKGYICTGWNITTPPIYFHQDVWEYDPQSDIWTQKANFPGPGRQGAVGFSIGSKGYIGLGGGGSGSVLSTFFNDFWEYDPQIDSWTQKADIPATGRQWAAGFSIGTKGYMGTGGIYPSGPYYSDFWEWDQATDTWVQKADFGGGARNLTSGFSIGSKGYLGTGYDGSPKNDFWEFDPASNPCPTALRTMQPPPITMIIPSAISVYPNPNSGEMTVNYSIPENQIGKFEIYNLIGVKVADYPLQSGGANSLSISETNLTEGIYMYRLTSDNKTIEQGKIVVIK